MKKVLFSMFAVALVATTLTSCKKDYTCECKDSTGAVLSSATLTATKSDAEAACNVTTGTGTYTVTCAIK